MDKNSIITLKVIQTDFEGQTNTVELMSEASFYIKDKTFYILYKETGLTGMEGTTTMVKVDGSIVSLIRYGSVTSNFIFEEGVTHSSDYGTQYGTIQMAIKANKVDVKIDQSGGDIFVDYEVEVGGEKLGYNSFYIKISRTSIENQNA